jgi:hypothetical protein
MKILEDDKKSARAGGVAKQGKDGFEEPELGLLRIATGRFRTPHLRQQLGQVLARGAEALAQRAHILPGEVVADGLEERKVWERKLGFAASARHNDAASTTSARDEVVDQPGLPHPRLPTDDDHASITPEGGQQRVLKQRDLGLATDQDFAQDSGEGHL